MSKISHNKYIFPILCLFLLISVVSKAQFNPTAHIVINDALGQNQMAPIEGRGLFWDATNFKWRDYQSTAEVLSTLPTNANRFSHFPVYIHSGGTLSGGVWTGGITQVWFFKDGLANGNLVRWYTDSVIVRVAQDSMWRLNDSTIAFTINGGPQRTVLVRGTAAGGINSLQLTVPTPFNSPINFTNLGGSWTGGLTYANQSAGSFLAGPLTGSPGPMTVRQMGVSDLPTGIPNGNLATSSISLSQDNTGTLPGFATSSVPLGGTLLYHNPAASATTGGYLTSTDWIRFNNSAIGQVLSVNGQVGNTIVMNADSIWNYPIDISNYRQGYVLALDTVHSKLVFNPPSSGSGITSLNGLTNVTQSFAIGNSGTSPNIISSGSIHTFNSPIVNGADTGIVTPGLYNSWNSKLNTAQNGLTDSSHTALWGGYIYKGVLVKSMWGNEKFIDFDSTSFFLARSVSINDSSKYSITTDTSSKYVNLSAANARASGYFRTNLVTTNDVVNSILVGKISSTSYGAPLLQMQSSDSSTSLRASRIIIDNDSTLTSSNAGIFMKGLKYTGTTTGRVAMIWDQATGKILTTNISTGSGVDSLFGLQDNIASSGGRSFDANQNTFVIQNASGMVLSGSQPSLNSTSDIQINDDDSSIYFRSFVPGALSKIEVSPHKIQFQPIDLNTSHPNYVWTETTDTAHGTGHWAALPPDSIKVNNLLSVAADSSLQVNGTSILSNTTLGFHDRDSLTLDSLKNFFIKHIPLLTSSAGTYVLVRDSVSGEIFDIPATLTDTTGVAAIIAAGGIAMAYYNNSVNKVMFQAVPSGPWILSPSDANIVQLTTVGDTVKVGNVTTPLGKLNIAGTLQPDGAITGTNTLVLTKDSIQIRAWTVAYQATANFWNRETVSLTQAPSPDTVGYTHKDVVITDANASTHGTVTGENITYKKTVSGGTNQVFNGQVIGVNPSVGDSIGTGSFWHANLFNPSGKITNAIIFDIPGSGSMTNINNLKGLRIADATANSSTKGIEIGTNDGAGKVALDLLGTGHFHSGGRNLLDSIIVNPGMPLISLDTTNYKVVVKKTSDGSLMYTNWPIFGSGGGGGGIGTDSTITVTSGSSSTVTNGYNQVVIDPSGGAFTNYTLTLPTTWHTSKNLLIYFGGTNITSGAVITGTLTIVAGSGQTLVQALTPGAFNFGEYLEYHLEGTRDRRISN